MDGQASEQMAGGNVPAPDPEAPAATRTQAPSPAPGDPASAAGQGAAEPAAPVEVDADQAEAAASTPAEGGEAAPEAGAEPPPEAGAEPAPEAGAEPAPEAGAEPAPEAGAEPPPAEQASPSPPAALAPTPMAEPAFAELLDKSLERARPVHPGDRLRGVVQRIEDQWTFLDYGGPSEALIETRELRDAEGNLKVGVGERIDITVASAGDQVVVHRMVRKTRDRSVLKQAFASGATVEGRVTGTNKGGFDVVVSGFRAFCPISQIDRVYCSDSQAFVGKTLPFRILEYKEGGRRIVVSRRVLLEEERRKQADVVRTRLQVGDEIEGTVVRLQPFGAFVDIGGIDGLVHVSELRHARVSDPADAVRVGQPLRVKVIGIERLGDEKGERISLSAKALESDPWQDVGGQLTAGDIVQGRVLRLMNYGAFVEVRPGVEGLLHVTELEPRVRHPREALSEGETIEVRVLELDPERKRLSLSRRLDPAAEPAAPPPQEKLEVGAAIVGKVSNVKPYGVFVRIHEPVAGIDGLLPASETQLEPGADLAAAFATGATVEAEVLRIDDRGRIRLTQRSAEERARRPERERPRREGGRGGGRRAEGQREPRREAPERKPETEDEGRDSKVASGLGIMASAFKRVLDGRG